MLRRDLPLELDLTLEVLEENEVLQKNVPPEVAVAELQVHQLKEKQKDMSNLLTTYWAPADKNLD